MFRLTLIKTSLTLMLLSLLFRLTLTVTKLMAMLIVLSSAPSLLLLTLLFRLLSTLFRLTLTVTKLTLSPCSTSTNLLSVLKLMVPGAVSQAPTTLTLLLA